MRDTHRLKGEAVSERDPLHQRAWSVSTTPFWSEEWMENLTAKMRGACQGGRQQYKKWNSEELAGGKIQEKWSTRLYFIVLCPSLLHSSNAVIWFTLYGSLMAAPSLQTRRYSSMARIHSMTIEAPITKVSPEHWLFHKLQSFELHL